MGREHLPQVPTEPANVVSEENNYLTWSYDVSDVNPSLYAPSTLPSHPASPSMSIVSASTEDSGM